VRGGKVVGPSGDFVSLGKAGVGLGEVGRGGNGEGERVGRDSVGIPVSLKVVVVSPGYSMSFVMAVVGVGEGGKDMGLEGDDAGMGVVVKSKVVVLGADKEVKCGRVSRGSVALKGIEEGTDEVGKGEEMEGCSMITTSGDCVSLCNTGVGVGEMGRDWATEEVRVERDDVGTRVSVVKMTPSEVCTSVKIVEVGIGQAGKTTDGNEMLSALHGVKNVVAFSVPNALLTVQVHVPNASLNISYSKSLVVMLMILNMRPSESCEGLVLMKNMPKVWSRSSEGKMQANSSVMWYGLPTLSVDSEAILPSREVCVQVRLGGGTLRGMLLSISLSGTGQSNLTSRSGTLRVASVG